MDVILSRAKNPALWKQILRSAQNDTSPSWDVNCFTFAGHLLLRSRLCYHQAALSHPGIGVLDYSIRYDTTLRAA